jgi:hypothetical protein
MSRGMRDEHLPNTQPYVVPSLGAISAPYHVKPPPIFVDSLEGEAQRASLNYASTHSPRALYTSRFGGEKTFNARPGGSDLDYPNLSLRAAPPCRIYPLVLVFVVLGEGRRLAMSWLRT